MRQYARLFAAAAIACAASACEPSGSEGAGPHGETRPTAERGALVVTAEAPDVAPGQVAVIDLALAREVGGSAGAQRVLWPTPTGEPWAASAPCDPLLGYVATARVVGLYAEAPARLGAVGAPAPPGGLPIEDFGVQRVALPCVAGWTSRHAFKPVVSPAAPRLGVEVSVATQPGEEAIVEVGVHGREPSATLWERRVSTVSDGDGGRVEVRGPCGDGADDMEAVELTVRLAGLFGAGADAPSAEVATFSTVFARRWVGCPEGDAHAVLRATPARRLEEEGAPLRVAFAGVRCGAAWRCQWDEGLPSALELSCESEGERAPVLYLDDVLIRCDQRVVATLDPSASAEIREDDGDAGPRTTWLAYFPEAYDAHVDGCVLEARATASTADRATAAGGQQDAPGAWMRAGAIVAGDIYPTLRWKVRLGQDSLRCWGDDDLVMGDPEISVELTRASEVDTVFPHRSR